VNPPELLAPGLDSLLRQLGDFDEAIVVTRRGQADQEKFRGRCQGDPGAAPPDTRSRPCGARDKAVAGDIVAVTEDHCIPDGSWIATSTGG